MSYAQAERLRFFSQAKIDQIIDATQMSAISEEAGFILGEVLGVESQHENIGVIGFVELNEIEVKEDGTRILKCRLLRQSKFRMIQPGDRLVQLNLHTLDPIYKGTTDLIIRRSDEFVSSRYKPLVTQGPSIGDTAQTLWKNESLITIYGLYNYGITDRLSFGIFIPNLLLNSFNWIEKYKVYESDSSTASVGLTYVKIPYENKSALNLNFYWDSLSSESTISHTFFSLALASWDGAMDMTAIKSLGTTSLQTGYEFILNDWDRVLMGPSYNFEKKSIGGYVSYVKIWDQFHLMGGISSNNISQMVSNPKDGYFLLVDAYWRY